MKLNSLAGRTSWKYLFCGSVVHKKEPKWQFFLKKLLLCNEFRLLTLKDNELIP